MPRHSSTVGTYFLEFFPAPPCTASALEADKSDYARCSSDVPARVLQQKIVVWCSPFVHMGPAAVAMSMFDIVTLAWRPCQLQVLEMLRKNRTSSSELGETSLLKAFFTRGSQISPAGARACSRQRRRRADKRRATRPGLQRGRLRRLRVSTSISLHSDSPTPAAACIFDCVPHCHAGRARSRKLAHKGLATRHGLLRERLRHPRVGIIMPVRSDTKTPVAACITDCAPHFCCQRP